MRVPEIVAIGASTGGLQALLEMLALLPADFALPILVVQHIAPGFVGAMVDWLKPQCPVPLQLAVAGRRLDALGHSHRPPVTIWWSTAGRWP